MPNQPLPLAPAKSRIRFAPLAPALFTALFAAWLCTPCMAQIYRCGNAYSHQPCDGATVVDTRATLNTHTDPKKTAPKQSGSGKAGKADKADAASNANRTSSANQSPAPESRTNPSSRKNKQHTPDKKQKTCAQLAQRIDKIDDRARLPSTARKQASLAQQRRDINSRMFDLGCHKPHGY